MCVIVFLVYECLRTKRIQNIDNCTSFCQFSLKTLTVASTLRNKKLNIAILDSFFGIKTEVTLNRSISLLDISLLKPGPQFTIGDFPQSATTRDLRYLFVLHYVCQNAVSIQEPIYCNAHYYLTTGANRVCIISFT